ncbi:MAG: hypothetical protein QME81_20450 [bacterium]|nr:hypothetical protein [bacterium]
MEPQKKGEHYIAWDGRNAHGKMVAGGVYIYYIEAGCWKGMHKIAVIR